jgi:hypothetical protein
MEKQLINITEWNEHEVRIELLGNGNYIPKEKIHEWVKENADRIALEISRNINR